jgi:hypothetical protein
LFNLLRIMMIIIINLNYFLLHLFLNYISVSMMIYLSVQLNIKLIVMIYIVFIVIHVVMVSMNVVRKLMKIPVDQMDKFFLIYHIWLSLSLFWYLLCFNTRTEFILITTSTWLIKFTLTMQWIGFTTTDNGISTKRNITISIEFLRTNRWLSTKWWRITTIAFIYMY